MHLHMQVLRQASLRVYNEGEAVTVDGSPLYHVFVLLRGSVLLHYRDGSTYLAGKAILARLQHLKAHLCARM